MRGITIGLLLLASAGRAAHAQQPLAVYTVSATGERRDARDAAIMQRHIALALVDAPVDRAVRQIASSAGLDVTYNPESVPASAHVTLRAQSITVLAAFTEVLAGMPLDVQITGETQLALVPRPQRRALDGTVPLTGIVRDSLSRQPIAGVNVVLTGTKLGTVTDADGWYHLRVPDGGGTLHLYRIGYGQRDVPFPAGISTVNVVMTQTVVTLSAVQVAAERRQQPVAHTTNLELVQEIKASQSVVSGISSEQIARQADINAAQIVRHISGVTVRDESFLTVRGMNQRYNATYIDDNLAPSTEQYSRAFDLSLIPDRIVDRILVYKSPRPDLIGDMTGAAVKIFTKDALAIRRIDVSLRLGDRLISTGKDMLSYSGGGTDWLGIDDGTRALPRDVPGFGTLQHATLSQSQYLSSMSPVLGPKTITAPPDAQLTVSYYDNWKLGRTAHLYNVTSGSYTYQSQGYGVYQQQGQTQAPALNNSWAVNTVNNYTEHDAHGSQQANLNLLEDLTLRLNQHHQLYFKNFILQQGTSTTIDQIRAPNDSLDVFQGLSGVGGTWTRNIILSWEQRFVWQANLGGTHDLTDNQNLAWNLGYTTALHSTPDQRTARFVNSNAYYPPGWPGGVGQSATGNFNDNWQPLNRYLQPQGGPYDQTGTISRIWTRNDETINNASLDYTVSPAPWVDVKLGTYDYYKARTVDRKEYLVEDGEMAQLGLGTPTFIDCTYTYPGSSLYVNQSLLHYSPQQLNSIWNSTYFPNNYTGWAVVDHTTPTDAYRANEVYDAGYLMMSLKPFNGRVEVVGGVRMEYDQIRLAGAEYEGAELEPNPGQPVEAIPLLIHRQALSTLPSVNLSWRPSDAVVFRAAYGKTVNRPEFREMAPFFDYDYVNQTVISGNPSVVQANIDNTEVRLELYPATGDLLSVGAFYKNLRNAIVQVDNYQLTTGIGIAFPEELTYANAPRAWVEGIELDARKRLLWGLSFTGSGALMNSRATGFHEGSQFLGVGGGGRPAPLQGQVPYIVDVGLAYDNPSTGTTVTATYNESGTSIYALGQVGAGAVGSNATLRGSILELPRGLFEVAIAQSFGPWRLKLSGQNLFNEAIRFAEDENFDGKYQPEHLVNKVFNGSYVPVYVGDNIFRRWNPGKYFLLTIQRSL